MTPLDAVRHRLQEIAATATTAAEALSTCEVDYLEPEVVRLLGNLDAVAERLTPVREKLAGGAIPRVWRWRPAARAEPLDLVRTRKL